MLEFLTGKIVQLSLSVSFIYAFIVTVFLLTTSSLYAPRSIPLIAKKPHKNIKKIRSIVKTRKNSEKWKQIIDVKIREAKKKRSPIPIESLLKHYIKLDLNKKVYKSDNPNEIYDILSKRIDKACLLHVAVLSEQSKKDFVKLLLGCGADSKVFNSIGQMPIDIAVTLNSRNGHEVLHLLLRDLAKKHPDSLVEFLNDYSVYLDKKHTIWGTFLHSATLAKNPNGVKLLLDHGADPRIPNSNGQIPIDIAGKLCFKEGYQLLL